MITLLTTTRGPNSRSSIRSSHSPAHSTVFCLRPTVSQPTLHHLQELLQLFIWQAVRLKVGIHLYVHNKYKAPIHWLSCKTLLVDVRACCSPPSSGSIDLLGVFYQGPQEGAGLNYCPDSSSKASRKPNIAFTWLQFYG